MQKLTASEVLANLAKRKDALVQCPLIAMYTRPERLALRDNVRQALGHKEVVEAKGLYVLYEGDRAMYVGRSDDIGGRLLVHGRPNGGSESATLAFNIAKALFPGTYPDSRKEFQQKEPALFTEAKERVRKMRARVIEVENDNEQAILEVYLHMELDTLLNSFRNH